MNKLSHICLSSFLLFILLAISGFGGSVSMHAQTASAPGAPSAFASLQPANRGLDAALYMQTSAEYRACCYQAFQIAAYRLKDALAAHPQGKPAVILDLDETVLDNAGFQAMTIRSNLAFDKRLWKIWAQEYVDQVALIPGAKEFILSAVKAGVDVFYISNRSEVYRDQTKQILKRLGIPLRSEDHLKLLTQSGDKSRRRHAVESEYNVLLYIGDNLRDFSETFHFENLKGKSAEELRAAINDRKKQVDEHSAEFGEKWIILPNTIYGEWMKPLGKGDADLKQLVPPVQHE